MGNFFRDQYDLYRSVVSDTQSTIVKLSQAVMAATGEDLQQELKDACVSISEHESYDFSFDEVDVLFRIIEDKIGVTGET